MRSDFIDSLHKLAGKDKDIMLLTADLGFSVFEEFEEKYPEQYINVGIAEQAMIGIAAGLACGCNLHDVPLHRLSVRRHC